MAEEIGEFFIPITIDREQVSSAIQGAQRDLTQRMRDMGSKMTSLGKRMTLGITTPILGAGAAIIKFGSDFDQAMTESTAIMGDLSKEQIARMKDVARSLSTEVAPSATQLAESYYFLASAGMDANQSIEALPAVARFAQAGAFDMAQATDLLTDAQTALGLSSKDANENLQNMERVSDVVVKGATLANASVEQLSLSLTNKAAAAFRAVGKPVEEAVAVLAAFADQGKKGQVAGEALNIIMAQLPKTATANAEQFAALGISVFDSAGKLKNMADIVAEFESALDGMSDAERAAAFDMAGINRSLADNLLALLGTSEKIREYEHALENAGGTTKEVSDKQLKSFRAQMGLLKDELISVALTFWEEFQPALDTLVPYLKNAASWLGDMAAKFGELNPQSQLAIAGIVAFGAALGPVLITMGLLVGSLGSIATALGGLLSPIAAVGVEIGAIGALVYEVYTHWDAMPIVFGEALKQTGKAISTALTFYKETFSKFGNWLLEKLIDVEYALLRGWTELLVKIRELVFAEVGYICEKIAWLRDNVVDIFNSMYHAVVGGSIVPDLVTDVLKEFDRMASGLGKKTVDITGEVTTAFDVAPRLALAGIGGMAGAGLDAMIAAPPGLGGGAKGAPGSMKVVVNNYSSAAVRVDEQFDAEGGRAIVMSIEEAVDTAIRSGRLASATAKAHGLARNPGVLR